MDWIEGKWVDDENYEDEEEDEQAYKRNEERGRNTRVRMGRTEWRRAGRGQRGRSSAVDEVDGDNDAGWLGRR